jgi:glutaredoxin-like protein
MPDKTILVYGADWCIDCRRARRFLSQNNIAYRWVNIEEDKEGEQIVIKLNRGMRSIPTIIFGDGSILVEPSNKELSRKLEIAV